MKAAVTPKATKQRVTATKIIRQGHFTAYSGECQDERTLKDE